MKNQVSVGASRPTSLSLAERVMNALNRVLPSECQVKTSTDLWHLATVFSLSITFITPYALILTVYCAIHAELSKKGGQSC